MPPVSLLSDLKPTPSVTEAQQMWLLSLEPATELPKVNMEMLNVANFDDIADKLVQAAMESDQLNQEEQNADPNEGLLIPSPNLST